MIGKKNPNLYYSLSFIFYFGLILSDTLFGPTDVEFLSNFHDCPSPTEFAELSVTNGGLTFGERFQISHSMMDALSKASLPRDRL